MIRVAICDDEPTTLNYLCELISKDFNQQGFEISLDRFSNGADFLKNLESSTFDIVFLDIKMPDMDGFAVAEKLRNFSDNTHIIFVTTEDGLVYESFDYQPFYFIPKTNQEILKSKLKLVVKKLTDKIAQNHKIQLTLPYGEEKYIYSDSVLYVFSKANYLNIVCESEVINVREKIDSFSEKLPRQTFARIHNRYIVNMQRIAAVDFTELKVILQNETTLDISRAYKHSFLEQYNIFQRNYV